MGTLKKKCRNEDLNLAYCSHNAVSQPQHDRGLPLHPQLKITSLTSNNKM